MALGGGTFLVQNKVLPGSYINFSSAAYASAALSERGIVTLPMELGWGEDNTIFTVTAEQFMKNSSSIFGYPYTHEKLKGLRELFSGAQTAHLFKLNSDGKKAANGCATARYKGERGNALAIVIESSPESGDESVLFDVHTVLDGKIVATQAAVAEASELKDNDYVVFSKAYELALTAGEALSGGANGAVSPEAYQTYLDKSEAYSFNTMACLSTDCAIKLLFARHTKRMRDECGAKFQTVLHRYSGADYEGVISLENGLKDEADSPELIYWMAGAQAGVAVSSSLTNTLYTGEYLPDTDYTQAELSAGIKSGKLMLHSVNGAARVLDDVNTFVSVTDEKGADFSSNQTMRVLDQIGNDIATLFCEKYLGRVPNDRAGRISLWGDIVKHHQELESIRAIEEFSAESVTVEAGDTKKSVIVTDLVTPTGAMAVLYMTVIVQ